jgi:hypothetical protein
MFSRACETSLVPKADITTPVFMMVGTDIFEKFLKKTVPLAPLEGIPVLSEASKYKKWVDDIIDNLESLKTIPTQQKDVEKPKNRLLDCYGINCIALKVFHLHSLCLCALNSVPAKSALLDNFVLVTPRLQDAF